MKTYIYYDKNLRCRIKLTGFGNQVELQIQKRKWIVWVNVYKWMTVQEGFWGEDSGMWSKEHPMKSSYRYGNVNECYPHGTLDIKERVDKFFVEYLEYFANSTVIYNENL